MISAGWTGAAGDGWLSHWRITKGQMLAFLRSPLHPPADVSGWRPYQIATGGKKQILRGGENCGASTQIRRLARPGAAAAALQVSVSSVSAPLTSAAFSLPEQRYGWS